MDDSKTNQTIHEWLGNCWHESEAIGHIKNGGYRCKKCGDNDGLAPFPKEWDKDPERGNPSYDTDLNAIRTAELKVIEKFGEITLGLALEKRMNVIVCKDRIATHDEVIWMTHFADAKTRAAAVLDVIQGDEK